MFDRERSHVVYIPSPIARETYRCLFGKYPGPADLAAMRDSFMKNGRNSLYKLNEYAVWDLFRIFVCLVGINSYFTLIPTALPEEYQRENEIFLASLKSENSFGGPSYYHSRCISTTYERRIPIGVAVVASLADVRYRNNESLIIPEHRAIDLIVNNLGKDCIDLRGY